MVTRYKCQMICGKDCMHYHIDGEYVKWDVFKKVLAKLNDLVDLLNDDTVFPLLHNEEQRRLAKAKSLAMQHVVGMHDKGVDPVKEVTDNLEEGSNGLQS